MRLLVAIANHGNGNVIYLEQLLAAYRQMPIKVSVVILSNIPKNLGHNIEVLVGVPSSNPWSLPFAHRQLFLDRLDDYDLFVYSEDDTLLHWDNIKSFLDSLPTLEGSESPGFIRTETAPDGAVSYSTCHSFFRWIPNSVKRRNGHLWAKYSNEHAALYIATRDQLKAAIKAGGFPIAPHEGRFDMLCSAATDIYTRGGLQRIVCIDRLHDFSLPHLPNKYIGKLGLPAEEMKWQVEALRKIADGRLSSHELLNPETKLPGCFGSKFLREKTERKWLELLTGHSHQVLVWGAGDGLFEASLETEKRHVTVFPLNSVMAECCRRRGLKVLPVNGSSFPSGKGKFDTIILSDVLHLVEDPLAILKDLHARLTPHGQILARIPNLHHVRLRRRRITDKRFKITWTREGLGATPFSPKAFQALAKKAGFLKTEIISVPSERFKRINGFSLGLFAEALSPYLYMRAKHR